MMSANSEPVMMSAPPLPFKVRKASPTSTDTPDALMVSAASVPLTIKLSALAPPPSSVNVGLELKVATVTVKVSVPLLLVSSSMASMFENVTV